MNLRFELQHTQTKETLAARMCKSNFHYTAKPSRIESLANIGTIETIPSHKVCSNIVNDILILYMMCKSFQYEFQSCTTRHRWWKIPADHYYDVGLMNKWTNSTPLSAILCRATRNTPTEFRISYSIHTSIYKYVWICLTFSEIFWTCRNRINVSRDPSSTSSPPL